MAELTGKCRDRAGNENAGHFGFLYDATAPVVTMSVPADGATFVLNQPVVADFACSDTVSQISLCAANPAATVDTSVPGSRDFTVNAVDVAGNATALTHRYSVQYRFDGFFAPLYNPPTINRGPVGRTFPVKFAIRNIDGVAIGDSAAVSSIRIEPAACSATAAEVTGNDTVLDAANILRFDAVNGQWIFNWKTTGLSDGCHALALRLADGSTHSVLVELR
jgi:hypothetical protein